MEIQPVIAWNERWSVGIQLLDEEHRQMVERINLLFAAAWARHVVSNRTFELLEEELKRHMVHESEILNKLGYSDVASHQKGLEALSEQLSAMKDKVLKMCRGGNQMLNKEAETFLRQWIVDCLEGNDGQYAAWLLGHDSVDLNKSDQAKA